VGGWGDLIVWLCVLGISLDLNFFFLEKMGVISLLNG
jgi:hypothetical protein